MNLHPARFEGEPFADYKVRRRDENTHVAQHLRGTYNTDWIARTRIIGKAAKRAAKRIKVAALKAIGRFQPPREKATS